MREDVRAYVTCVSGSPLVPDHCAGRAVHRGQSNAARRVKGAGEWRRRSDFRYFARRSPLRPSRALISPAVGGLFHDSGANVSVHFGSVGHVQGLFLAKVVY